MRNKESEAYIITTLVTTSNVTPPGKMITRRFGSVRWCSVHLSWNLEWLPGWSSLWLLVWRLRRPSWFCFVKWLLVSQSRFCQVFASPTNIFLQQVTLIQPPYHIIHSLRRSSIRHEGIWHTASGSVACLSWMVLLINTTLLVCLIIGFFYHSQYSSRRSSMHSILVSVHGGTREPTS